MALTTREVRAAAAATTQAALGVGRLAAHPDAPPLVPRPLSAAALAPCAEPPAGDDFGLPWEFAYGEVWTRAGLRPRTRSLVTVGILCAEYQPDQLLLHINSALNLDVSPEEIYETLTQAALYAGVPAWRNGTHAVSVVLEQRGTLVGVQPIGAPRAPESYEERDAARRRAKQALGIRRIGTGEQARPLPPLPGGQLALNLSSTPLDDEIRDLQELYEFGDVWSRPFLSYQDRSLITVGVLTALQHPDQLHTHINTALNLGISPEEIHETLMHAATLCGEASWHDAVNIARHVFAERGEVGQ